MDEGIEIMPIEQTSSKPQFPWWVSQVSTDEYKIGALKARASTPLASRERGGRTLQLAKFELIRQVTHDLLLFYLD